MKNNSQPFLIAILMVLIANLVATVLVYQKISMNNSVPTANTSTAVSLPEEISKAVIEGIFADFKEKFNTGSLESFSSLFSEFARSQMKAEDMEKNYAMLRDYFGDVASGTYSHYVFAGRQGNLIAFNLHFIVDLGNDSKFGSAGTAKIGITWDGSEYGIISSHIFAGAQ